jgi:hypothetical protein
MKAFIALVIVLWWVAAWGLTDLIVEGWTRRRRVVFYSGLLAFVSLVFSLEPHLLDRL